MVTKPTRRVVPAGQVMEDALAIAKEDFQKPATATPVRLQSLGELERVTRQLDLASLALNKYQRKLESKQELTYDEERMFLMHQDSIRKLEVSLSQLKSKSDNKKKSDLDISLEMIDRGMDFEDVIRVFGGNKDLIVNLKEALSDRE